MKDRWKRQAYNPRRHQQRDAEFADTVKFLTILVIDPIFSRYALDSFMNKGQRSKYAQKGSYVKNVRTNIQLLSMIISIKGKIMHQEKMMKKEETHQTDAQKQMI